MNAYIEFTKDALAFIHKAPATEEKAEVIDGLRKVSQFIAESMPKIQFKAAQYIVYLNGHPKSTFSLRHDADKYAEFCGGEVRAV